MNKVITTDPAKLELVERLLKRGAIDFKESLMLLEVEVKVEYSPSPYTLPLFPQWPTISYGEHRLLGHGPDLLKFTYTEAPSIQ